MSDVPGGPTPPPPPPPPPPMMGGPQGGMAPKTLGEILSAAFNIYKANASKLILIVAIVVVPLSFISALFSGVVFAGTKHTGSPSSGPVVVVDRSFGLLLAGALVAAVISVIITAVLQAAILRAAAQATIGDPVDAEESYRFGFKRLGSVILVSAAGRARGRRRLHPAHHPGAHLPGPPLGVVPVLIVENRRGSEAMSRSWNLVKGHFWHAFGVIIVAGLIVGFIVGDHRRDRRQRVGRPVDLLRDRADTHRAVHRARLGAAVPGSACAERGAVGRHAARRTRSSRFVWVASRVREGGGTRPSVGR